MSCYKNKKLEYIPCAYKLNQVDNKTNYKSLFGSLDYNWNLSGNINRIGYADSTTAIVYTKGGKYKTKQQKVAANF